MKNIESQREILKQLIKQVETRIKEAQQEVRDAFTQEDAWVKQGIVNELIGWKISLERWCKKLKHEISEEL
jgi:hypothetical protein